MRLLSSHKLSTLQSLNHIMILLINFVTHKACDLVQKFPFPELHCLVHIALTSVLQPFRFLPYFNETVLDEVKEVFRTDKRWVIFCLESEFIGFMVTCDIFL